MTEHPEWTRDANGALMATDFRDLPRITSGKVRDIYALDDDLLLVTSDRISAFDWVMGSGIPDKGIILNQISAFWFDRFRTLVPNAVKLTDGAEDPRVPARYRDVVRGRSMVMARCQMFPVECVARGYLAGSATKEYRQTGTVCGIALPPGLVEASKLPEPIFTPATKADTGHDENISFARAAELVGDATAKTLRDLTLTIYGAGRDHAESRGIILADTKFEFGLRDGAITLADEVLTPDSSRFWPVDGYRPGVSPPSFDKQFLRNYLETTGWDKNSPPPPLPADVVAGTRARYVEALERLTGRRLPGPS
jgi:phosphoribosylaminoimidazole-succinocarboxamide synthase